MRVIAHEGQQWVLRFDPGEELIAGLSAWCQQERVTAATLSGIGACGELSLAFLDRVNRRYVNHATVADYEICSFSGTIAMADDQVVVHAHGTFADAKLNVIGGHVQRAVISVTGEVSLIQLSGPLARRHDAASGVWRLADAP